MSKGGSDCCGTCWFNTRNLNQGDEEGESKARCSIRNIEIDKPFWTYCANHPHHNPDRVEVTVGPVYKNDGSYPNTRTVWLHSPDTPELRNSLIGLLEKTPEVPPPRVSFWQTLRGGSHPSIDRLSRKTSHTWPNAHFEL